MKRIDRPLTRLVFVALLSFSVLAVCSKSSFLYPLNDWVDVNCFFTVGRGIVHGLMPYRDLYEQKGPLLYLLYALASLVSESSFLGVYLAEAVCFSCFLHLSGRIAQTMSGSKVIYWPAAAVMALAVPLSGAYNHGSSAEGTILPVLALGLWLVLRAMREDRALRDKEGFVLGLCAAAALWVKYTFCGLFAGLALAVILWYLFTGKARQLPRLIGFFLLGCLALSAPIVGWFAATGALGDLWQVYFIDNLTKYTQRVGLRQLAVKPFTILTQNPSWCVLSAIGLIWTAAGVKKRRWEPIAVWLSAGCLFAFTYFGGRTYVYYALVLAVYAPLGLAAAGKAVRRLTGQMKPGKPALAGMILALALLVANPFIALGLSSNVYLMRYRLEETPYGRFAKIINSGEDRSLFNYGFLDGGFYFAAGYQPTERYFCMLNLSSPEMRAAQEACVAEKKAAFVVVRDREQDPDPHYWQKVMDKNEGYSLVERTDWVVGSRNITYHLYQRIDGTDAE